MQMMYNFHLQSKSLWHYYLFHSHHLDLFLLQAGCLNLPLQCNPETLTGNIDERAFCILLCIFLSTVRIFYKRLKLEMVTNSGETLNVALL